MKTYSKSAASVFFTYHQCPSTGRTIEALRGDDKALCNCDAAMRRGGTHLISACAPSTVEKWMAERGYVDREAS